MFQLLYITVRPGASTAPAPRVCGRPAARCAFAGGLQPRVFRPLPAAGAGPGSPGTRRRLRAPRAAWPPTLQRPHSTDGGHGTAVTRLVTQRAAALRVLLVSVARGNAADGRRPRANAGAAAGAAAYGVDGLWPAYDAQHATTRSMHVSAPSPRLFARRHPNGNGYYIMPKNRWYVESGRYDEKGAGGGLGQWDRDHHFDVWGKVCAPCIRAAVCASCVVVSRGRNGHPAAWGEARAGFCPVVQGNVAMRLRLTRARLNPPVRPSLLSSRSCTATTARSACTPAAQTAILRAMSKQIGRARGCRA